MLDFQMLDVTVATAVGLDREIGKNYQVALSSSPNLLVHYILLNLLLDEPRESFITQPIM